MQLPKKEFKASCFFASTQQCSVISSWHVRSLVRIGPIERNNSMEPASQCPGKHPRIRTPSSQNSYALFASALWANEREPRRNVLHKRVHPNPGKPWKPARETPLKTIEQSKKSLAWSWCSQTLSCRKKVGRSCTLEYDNPKTCGDEPNTKITSSSLSFRETIVVCVS